MDDEGDTAAVNEIILRAAEPGEADALTALTRRSKAYWGYPQAMLDRWAEMLTISSATIRDGRVVVAERDGVLAGYYHISGEPPHGELADLFLEPEVIGTGLGRKLWEHAVESACSAGFHTLTLESDPHAEAFYLRMGAERVGEREVAPGRWLPILRATVNMPAS
ncbi:N-acetylglutamate synthase-like GNAT family acetyltransferase [Nonomuraea polychroma]|uniref:N-acetylglutamate synthase-like GNAT family acetyltransferase n=1 Tax=Nonomuraea polychroma TaxID=46176 RepID=A0A438MLT2_9ACTN|nr:GNAT family N-acetyltransferase [Nonomuraea polychroma]RVX46707.1 N-acetylglutamate synthase-like GNAT family acetyltransferase [Nonomuraea polychroma]